MLQREAWQFRRQPMSASDQMRASAVQIAAEKANAPITLAQQREI